MLLYTLILCHVVLPSSLLYIYMPHSSVARATNDSFTSKDPSTSFRHHLYCTRRDIDRFLAYSVVYLPFILGFMRMHSVR
ncbi:hypothetical protein C8Q72DRAFT_817939 [Fomitopsis betulina]|nr:hypothetical protein C8Q72DRAFT_817939 [Fomitopsis betulina]